MPDASSIATVPAMERSRLRRGVARAFVAGWAVSALFSGALLGTQSAVAQENYPDHEIRMILPYAAGGGADILMRIVADGMSKRLGQPVIIDNRAGASGNIGTELGAHADPDGYTLVVANVAPMAINAGLYSDLPYDPKTDFTPIGLVASFPNVLVVRPDLGVKSLPELVALAKEKPGELTFAAALGSVTHLTVELLKTQAGIDLLMIPYKASGEALHAVLCGEVPMYFSSLPAALPHIESGSLVGLGISSLERSDAAPDLPTVAEQGFDGFEAVTWNGIAGPPGLPAEIVSKLHDVVEETIQDPAIVAKMGELGATPMVSTPEEFQAYIVSEGERWAEVVRTSGAKPEE